ncbi:MAG: MCP four helix bundle domain-containing protein [Eubacterium sp.]|nr:MCP four helix bundle domain-containing protein [Eubacterium sp.]
MKVSQRLRIGFSIVVGLAALTGIIGINGMSILRKSELDMYEKQVVALEYLGNATEKFNQMQVELNHVVISGFYDDTEEANYAKENFEDFATDFENWILRIEKLGLSDDAKELYDGITNNFNKGFLAEARQTIELSISDIPKHSEKFSINEKLNSLSENIKTTEDLLRGLMTLKSTEAKQTNMNNTNLTTGYIWIQLLLIALAIAAAIIITSVTVSDIARPTQEAATVLQDMANGNFDVRIKGYYKGEFEMMKNSINNTSSKLSSYFNDKLKAEQSQFDSKLSEEKAVAAREAIMDSIIYASKIQRNLISNNNVFEKSFSDYSIIWSPRDIVGGDIYWIKNFSEGTVLCVCDCTGHGTPGALLTMLVVSAFESQITEQNYKDTAEIIWLLERKLVSVLNVDSDAQTKNSIMDINDGCDLAVLYISKTGNVTVSSANTHVFICDGNVITQIKGQKMFIGEGRIKNKEQIKITEIPANPDNKFYIASDGMYDQMGGNPPRPFGYKRFKQIIQSFHSEKQRDISNKVWAVFEEYRGNQQRRDDFELITFKP